MIYAVQALMLVAVAVGCAAAAVARVNSSSGPARDDDSVGRPAGGGASTVAPQQCNQGPEGFCLSLGPWAAKCGFPPQQRVALCGYSAWPQCEEMQLDQLCTETIEKGIEGGVSGVSPRFESFVLAAYWAPTYCKHDQGSGFCSPFAGPGSPAAMQLALHGLWPDWGAPNGAKATSWPQFCGDFYGCQGGNITKQECLTPAGTLAALNTSAALQKYAPAWAAPRGAAGANLGDHEWAKHGSCAGVSNLQFAEAVLAKGIPEVAGRGAVFKLGAATTGMVALPDVIAAYGDTAVLTCDKGCTFGQIFLCYGKDASGKPTNPIRCPAVSLKGDTCRACATLTLPSY